MIWFPVALVALLLAALAAPFVVSRLTKVQRARHLHRQGVLHWYPNYDEDLRFEPRNERNIIAVSRRDLKRLGYRPTGDPVRVPRTFRRRVAGDRMLRLWCSADAALRPIWICCWVHRIELSRPREVLNPVQQLNQAILGRFESGPAPIVTRAPVAGCASDDAALEHETDRFSCAESRPPGG